MLQKRTLVCWEFTTYSNPMGTIIRAVDSGLGVAGDERKTMPQLFQALQKRNIAHLEQKFGTRAKRSAVQVNGDKIQLMMFTA